MNEIQKAQACLDKYGYIAMASTKKLAVGDVATDVTMDNGDLFGHPLVVIGPCSQVEFDAQRRYLNSPAWNYARPYYYKVTAE